MTRKSATICRCAFAALIVVAAYGVYVADRQGLAFAVPPKTALQIALGLFLMMGVVIGVLTSWLVFRKQDVLIGDGYEE